MSNSNTTTNIFANHKGWSHILIPCFKKPWKNNQVGYSSSPPNASVESDCKSSFVLLPAMSMKKSSSLTVDRDEIAFADPAHTHEMLEKLQPILFANIKTGETISPLNLKAHCKENAIPLDAIYYDSLMGLSQFSELLASVKELPTSYEESTSSKVQAFIDEATGMNNA
jgi:hypothetical protein